MTRLIPALFATTLFACGLADTALAGDGNSAGKSAEKPTVSPQGKATLAPATGPSTGAANYPSQKDCERITNKPCVEIKGYWLPK